MYFTPKQMIQIKNDWERYKKEQADMQKKNCICILGMLMYMVSILILESALIVYENETIGVIFLLISSTFVGIRAMKYLEFKMD